jgi:hypothetical protein
MSAAAAALLDARDVAAQDSLIPDAGTGLVIRPREQAPPSKLREGTIVAWYAGQLLSPRQYFALDAAGSRRVDYAHALPGTDFALVPPELFLEPSAAQVSIGLDVYSAVHGNEDSAPPVMLGHFCNDGRHVAVSVPHTHTDPDAAVAAFERDLRRYARRPREV